jgi:hypothetical protein
VENSYETFDTKEEITTIVNDKDNGFKQRIDDKDGSKLEIAKTNTLQFFDDDGNIQDPKIEGVTIVDDQKLI